MIGWLFRLWRDRPDPHAVMQTPVVKISGFDPSKGSAAYQKSLTRTPSGSPLRLKDTPTSRPDNVRAMNRKAL